ncbi:TolB family protein [Novosphingobium resinovorum]
MSDRDGRENLWIADADGSNARRVSQENSGAPHYGSPAWSPDGHTLYVSRMIWGLLAFELWSFDAASGKADVLVKAQPHGDDPHPQRRNAMGVVASPTARACTMRPRRARPGPVAPCRTGRSRASTSPPGLSTKS